MKTLCELVPEWISFSSVKRRKISHGKNNASSSNGSSSSSAGRKKSINSTMVCLCESIPYQSIREKLGARRTFGQTKTDDRKGDDNNNNNCTSQSDGRIESNENCDSTKEIGGDRSADPLIAIADKKNGKEKSSSSSSLHSSTSPSSSPSSSSLESISKSNYSTTSGETLNSSSGIARKRNSSDSFKKTDNNIMAHHQHVCTSTNEPQPKKRKSKLSLSARRYNSISTGSKNNTNIPQSQTSPSSDNDDDDDEDPSGLLRKAGIEEKKMLRVNYCQHLTSSDMDGGEVIHSSSTNPRGLKRMFSLLNAGERI
mmetsp:Transcript_25044/g.37455  ORF Transcript_25044/g.37455 Transcript_25044/m.37455 type:complete len:312 (+) Transcript_25044:112-1047(+)